MQDVRRMQLGEVVDFCIDYNSRQKQAEKTTERKRTVKHYRLATPEEVDGLLRS